MAQIGIVVPAYNGARFLRQMLESVLAQTVADWELVVVDDGSHDETPEIVRRFADRDRRIRLVQQGNGGVAVARNRGMAELSADCLEIAFLDHDDVWEADALATLSGALERDPQAAGAYGLARFVDAQGRPDPTHELEAFGRRRRGVRDGSLQDWPPTWPTGLEVMAVGCCISTPGQVLIRRQALGAAEPFDAAAAPSDDWDLWLRLCTAGHLAFVDRLVIGWRQHDNNASRQHRSESASIRYTRAKLARSPQLTNEQRRLIRLADRWHRWDASQWRARWARSALIEGRVLDAANHLRHAVVDRIAFHTSRV